MNLPIHVREILDEVGQVGTEVSCSVEGCREFVAVSKASAYSIHNFLQRFPYFADCEWVFHAYRYRIRSNLVESHANISPEDLWDYQKIYIADEAILAQVLSMWLETLNMLGRPAECDLPV